MNPSVEFDTIKKIEAWQSLVHVCRRWRCVVFGSPRRLNLQVCCYPPTRSAEKCLNVWPALPLVIFGSVVARWGPLAASVDDAIAELEHYGDRTCQINIRIQSASQIEKLRTAMQVPFPELTGLCLSTVDLYMPVFPDSFLGGSAPLLRHLHLQALPFPALPKLLLSATHLVNLALLDTPRSGYVSPETMAACLSTLTSLETLQFGFELFRSNPDLESRRPLPPPTRSVLPTLLCFSFSGVSEYSEEFMARIEAPQLDHLSITFVNDVDLKAPELNQFIGRTPKLGAYDAAHVFFGRHNGAQVRLCPEPSDHRTVKVVKVAIRFPVSDPQPNPPLSTLAQICASSLRPLLTMENLYICDYDRTQPPNIEKAVWLDLFLPFTAVKNLYLFKTFPLQELTGERVLPALQNVFLEGFKPSEPVQELFANFISARQLAYRPVAISAWRAR